MHLIFNIIWFIFGGFLSGAIYILGGLAMCFTIIGIPFGLQQIKLGIATFAPFGKKVVEGPGADGCVNIVLNVIWIILFGWEIVLAHLVFGVALCILIVTIPFGLQHIKLIPLSLLPFGRKLVRADEAA
ncbi:MAG: YccF domain-containing protein [Thermoanaerobaculia bacterium]|nr:YccF domain-containing protein [Thermoanaerobaculia bacterium]